MSHLGRYLGGSSAICKIGVRVRRLGIEVGGVGCVRIGHKLLDLSVCVCVSESDGGERSMGEREV